MEQDPDDARMWADIGRGAVKTAAGLAFVAAFGGSIALGWFVTPFHYVDCLAVVAVALGPAILLGAVFAGLGDRLAAGLGRAGPMGALNAVAGLALVTVVCPGNVALWLNQRLDASPAVVETVPVVETWTRTGKHSTTWLAGVATAVPSPIWAHSLYGAQPVALPAAEWRRVVPGQTRLVLREHRGALRMPWFEPAVALAD